MRTKDLWAEMEWHLYDDIEEEILEEEEFFYYEQEKSVKNGIV